METEALPEPVDGVWSHFILKIRDDEEEEMVSFLKRKQLRVEKSERG